MNELASFRTVAKHSNLSRAISHALQDFLDCFDIPESDLLLIREDLERKFDELIVASINTEGDGDSLETFSLFD